MMEDSNDDIGACNHIADQYSQMIGTPSNDDFRQKIPKFVLLEASPV